METLTKERIPEYLERDEQSRILQLQGQLLYTPKHIWIKLTPQGNVKLGITDYFQSQLKEIVYIHSYEAEEKVYKDEDFGMADTWWFTYGLYSPLNGKIVSVNKSVIDNPFTLNADPHQWMVEVQPNAPDFTKELNKLLSFEEYKKLITKLEERPHYILILMENQRSNVENVLNLVEDHSCR